MKLKEALLLRNKLQFKFQTYKNMYTVKNLDLNKNKETVADLASILAELSELKLKILKTNLSYEAKIKNANDEEISVTIQELFDMIVNNRIILSIFSSNLDPELDIKSVFHDYEKIFNYQKESFNTIEEITDRLVYLQVILDKAERSVELIED